MEVRFADRYDRNPAPITTTKNNLPAKSTGFRKNSIVAARRSGSRYNRGSMADPISNQDANWDALYAQLHQIARRRLAEQSPGQTLQATALVHEAYLRLQSNDEMRGLEHRRFLALAADVMRKILIDHARARGRIKRGGNQKRRLLDVATLAEDGDADLTLALNDAICRLEQLDDQAARVVKLRFFAGLSVEETADVLEVSPRTVKRDWQFARAWLYQALGLESDGPTQ
jgi:RNA polymerase sigma factor (TIGR02999 family)